MENSNQKLLIIGAGLCGSLMALRMAQRGYQVQLVEKRPDLRDVTQDAGRSINLSLSDRGLKALRLAGVEEQALELCIPMYGRMIHDQKGNTFMSNYSGRDGEYINSISRPGLNMLLLDKAEEMQNVELIFNKGCTAIDLEKGTATFTDYNTKQESTFEGDLVLATDGAGSVVRKAMFEKRELLFSFSQQWLTHGYKEITIPATKDGGYRTEKGALHIWPRGEDMLIALPNLDGSFTVTLFAPYANTKYCFDNLTTPEMVQEYFTQEYPDAIALMPNLVTEFFDNPTGPLGTIRCSPWHCYEKVVLLGDAAHAIVPFYGQGMNASFEDVFVFDSVLNQFEGDWATVFSEFQKQRKIDADAIADLAIDNYYEMRDHVANPLFKEKRIVEMGLEKFFPTEYFSKYSLVTFNEHIGYHEAMTKGRAQDKVLLKMVEESKFSASPKTTKEEMTILLEKVQEETNKLLK